MNASLNAAQSSPVFSTTWENTRCRTEEEACGLLRRPSRYHIELQPLCISLQGPPTPRKATRGRTRKRLHSMKLSNLESKVCDIFRQFTSSNPSQPINCLENLFSLLLLTINAINVSEICIHPTLPSVSASLPCLLSLSLTATAFHNGYNDTFTSQITTCRDCQALAQNLKSKCQPFKKP